MKLGLKYLVINQGTKEFPILGDGAWNKPAYMETELSSIMTLSGIAPEDTTSIFVGYKFIPEGKLLCIAKRIVGRGNDTTRSNAQFWVFIPSGMDIRIEEIQSLVNELQRLVGQPFPTISRYQESMPEIFKNAFRPLEHTPVCSLMQGRRYAVINYDDNYTIGRILSYGYQRNFGEFGFIILNKAGQRQTSLETINPQSLVRRVWAILPHTWPTNIAKIKNFTVKINGEVFPQEGAWIVPGEHALELSKPEYESIKGTVSIPESLEDVEMKLGEEEWNRKIWKKQIDLSIFKIYNSKRQDISQECKFYFLDKWSKKTILIVPYSNRYANIDIDKIKDCYLEIESQGYKPFIYEESLETLSPYIDITMEFVEEKINTKYEGCTIDITIKGPKAREIKLNGFSVKNQSVIDLKERYNENSRKGSNKKGEEDYTQKIDSLKKEIKRQSKRNKLYLWLISFLSIATITFLTLWLIDLHKQDKEKHSQIDNGKSTAIYGDNSPRDSQVHDTKEQIEQNEDLYSIEEAIKYLDENIVWTKSDMEKYPGLKGLWNDLNSMDRDKIINTWGPKLMEKSENFRSVFKAVKKNKDKEWNPFVGSHLKRWNMNPDDYTIAIENYKNWFDNNCTDPNKNGEKAIPASPTNSKPSHTGKVKEKSIQNLQEDLGN